jgi:hypothetical protein
VTDPQDLAESFAWLQSLRGIGRGLTDVHAGRLLAYMDRLAHEWRAMRDQRDDDQARVAALAEAVEAAPLSADGYADLARAVGGLLELTPRPSPTPRKLEVAS